MLRETTLNTASFKKGRTAAALFCCKPRLTRKNVISARCKKVSISKPVSCARIASSAAGGTGRARPGSATPGCADASCPSCPSSACRWACESLPAATAPSTAPIAWVAIGELGEPGIGEPGIGEMDAARVMPPLGPEPLKRRYTSHAITMKINSPTNSPGELFPEPPPLTDVLLPTLEEWPDEAAPLCEPPPARPSAEPAAPSAA